MARTIKDPAISGGETGWSHTNRWDPDYYIPKCAELARKGFSRREAAGMLGINEQTLKYWWNKYPELREAVNAARAEPVEDKTGERGGSRGCRSSPTLKDYIYGRLEPELQAVWRRIEKADQMETPQETVEAILADCGKTARQKLWLHCWMGSRFNKTEACRKTGISIGTIHAWNKTDPDFSRLFEQMLEVKKDYAEACLFDMAPENAQVAIFLNRCLNRDRGYDPKLGVDVQGTVSHELAEAEDVLAKLDPTQLRQLLLALRDGQKKLPPRSGVVLDQTPAEEEDS